MAEKKKSMGFDEIMRNLKAGNFSPIYILMGNEAYYIDKIADYIAENALAPHSIPDYRDPHCNTYGRLLDVSGHFSLSQGSRLS